MDDSLMNRLFRDKLCSVLLIITFSICIFSIYNFSDVIGKYQKNESYNNKYKNKYRGEVLYKVEYDEDGYFSGIIKVDKSDLWGFAKALEVSNVSRKRISLNSFLSDGKTRVNQIFDFSDEYLEDIDTIYDKRKNTPGIYISKGMVDSLIKEDGKRYLIFDGNKYLVKGVYKDFSINNDDYRVIIPWKNLTKNEKYYYVDAFKFRLENLEMLQLDIESNGDIESELQLLETISQKNNLIVKTDKETVIEDMVISKAIVNLIMIIFAIINSIMVINVWITRRKEELMIKKAWGMSDGMLFINSIFELSKQLVFSLPLVVILQMVYILIFDKTVVINIYKYGYFIGGTVLILVLMAYISLIRIRKLKPAEGLRGE